jgi:hypothetical protein
MPRCRFVTPDVVRIALTDDDWIDVKRELTTGEQRQMFAAMRSGGTFDPGRVGIARQLAYIVAWSFIDPTGRPAPLDAATLDDLDTDSSRELREAIDAHEAAGEAAREAQKKTRRSGATPSAPILQSVG